MNSELSGEERTFEGSDTEHSILWRAPASIIKKHILKLTIAMNVIMFLFLSIFLFEYFVGPFEKTVVLMIIIFILIVLFLGICLDFRNFRRLKNGKLTFEIRKDGIQLLSGRFIPKEKIEFVFIDLNREKWATIKTKDTPPMDIDEKLLSDYKKFFFSIPWKDRLKNDFEHKVIPDMDEFIRALRKCDIDVYVCKEGSKRVKKVK